MPARPNTVYGVHPRTATRALVVAVTFSLLLVVFHEPLFILARGLSAPDGLSGRRLTLLLLAALSAFPPLLVATALADALYDRYLTPK